LKGEAPMRFKLVVRKLSKLLMLGSRKALKKAERNKEILLTTLLLCCSDISGFDVTIEIIALI
jgi:hypothetical protein